MYDKIELGYKFNELEPYIDAKTVEIHYGKHLQTYVNNLNNLLKGYEDIFDGKSLEELLKNVSDLPEEIRQGVINQGGGVYNHNLYFSILSPKASLVPEGNLLEKINQTFGNVDNLKDELSKKAIAQFGSGYASLLMDRNKNLFIKSTSNQDTNLQDGLVPILTIDVWEHAYYLKYQNLRADYVNNIWNIIDWKKVSNLYNS
ncbi:superoxide dismutase [Mn] 2 [[Clostridium] bifermentans ATCC 638]|uniref:Superoxide dismutase n=2 Tax=Paraclostridium bifermentans TaxID=1490 RepID=A0A5P3XJL2_PARBF|nr:MULTISPECIES: superoxide dismutase [Paraclostridium]EQK43245.1 superoxide dismutase [Mn] 2 [[Clostridium] bifermentans ATCC 638] [Paraclostridium bifermentans ATCC 638 = DSM 14991]MBN8047583.1 superoxide dismutase [Paraclostridium bifermentans]MBZ6004315.1 superoxide dismutase [Paraclostridium bifermentans]MCU9812088.1 superoxide dismutase [Paraclostridium sp. AKS81]MDU0296161.1 superoxide dismutase [Paraclostridium sp. MRS3W1]